MSTTRSLRRYSDYTTHRHQLTTFLNCCYKQKPSTTLANTFHCMIVELEFRQRQFNMTWNMSETPVFLYFFLKNLMKILRITHAVCISALSSGLCTTSKMFSMKKNVLVAVTTCVRRRTRPVYCGPLERPRDSDASAACCSSWCWRRWR